jgi:predicted transcriptional regulator
MTPQEYRLERQKRGSQQAVAKMLGVDYRTIQRREAGEIVITHEAALSLQSLKVPRKALNTMTKKYVDSQTPLRDVPE